MEVKQDQVFISCKPFFSIAGLIYSQYSSFKPREDEGGAAEFSPAHLLRDEQPPVSNPPITQSSLRPLSGVDMSKGAKSSGCGCGLWGKGIWVDLGGRSGGWPSDWLEEHHAA